MVFDDPVSLRDLWTSAGVGSVETAPLVVLSGYAEYNDYRQPFETGTGPGGQYCVA